MRRNERRLKPSPWLLFWLLCAGYRVERTAFAYGPEGTTKSTSQPATPLATPPATPVLTPVPPGPGSEIPSRVPTSTAPRIQVTPSDASHVPTFGAPSLVRLEPRSRPHALLGWSGNLIEAPFADRRRRLQRTARPAPFGHRLQPGEALEFDVSFAGNPAGLAGARVVAIEPDPRGPPPLGAGRIRLEGHASTSGVVSLLATITDHITTHVDATTGAPVTSVNRLERSGLPGRYRQRETTSMHEGRAQVRLIDIRDGETNEHLEQVPSDTFDALSIMAWVRFLELAPGERAKAHAIDGRALMRVEIVSRGPSRLQVVPSLTRALGLAADDVYMIEGTVTRVDKFDTPLPGRRTYTLRAWLSDDTRKIPLVLESDMWLGSIRLTLSSYHPPSARP